MVCSLSSPIDVKMTLEGPTLSFVVADNDVVEALRGELEKCKSDHERELELARMEYANEVHSLKACIEELTNLASIAWNTRPKDECQWVTPLSSHIMIPLTTSALLWSRMSFMWFM